MSNKGLIFVISAPSGGGKTSVVRKIIEKDRGIKYIVSATTRPIAQGERKDLDYIFLSEQEFEEWTEKGRFIETTTYQNQRYGTPREHLLKYITNGDDVLLDIDVNGGQKVKEIFPEAILIFLLPPSRAELAQRLKERGREMETEIKKRLDHAEKEIIASKNYDYLVVNDSLDIAVKKIRAIIIAERCRRGHAVSNIWIKGG